MIIDTFFSEFIRNHFRSRYKYHGILIRKERLLYTDFIQASVNKSWQQLSPCPGDFFESIWRISLTKDFFWRDSVRAGSFESLLEEVMVANWRKLSQFIRNLIYISVTWGRCDFSLNVQSNQSKDGPNLFDNLFVTEKYVMSAKKRELKKKAK